MVIPPDRRLAAVLIAGSVAYLLGAFQISAPEGQYAAVGPRLFPLVIGGGLLTSAVWIGVAGTGEVRLPTVQWGVAASSALAFLAYIAALDLVGYLPATAGFLVLESRLLGSRDWARDLIVSLAITTSVYVVFRLLLGLSLPAGRLVS
jgi:putative tricarboxylic transport membrane protein